MIDPRRQKWLSYTRKIADLMGLKDWEIKIGNDGPENTSYEAQCYIPEGRRLFTLYLSDSFLDNTKESQRQTIVHELQHCHSEVFRLSVMKSTTVELWDVLRISFEHSIDDTAVYIAKFLPLPESDDEKKEKDEVPKVPPRAEVVRPSNEDCTKEQRTL